MLCIFLLVRAQSLSYVRPMDYSPPGSFFLWNFPGKNTGMGCHIFLQGIFTTQGLNPCFLLGLHILYH